jgi:hypothetical protein
LDQDVVDGADAGISYCYKAHGIEKKKLGLG